METFFSRYKNPLVLAIVLVAQFFLLAVQVRRPFPAAAARVDQAGVHAIRYGVASVVTPPESVLHRGGLSFRNIWSSYLDLVGVNQENKQLKEELDRLRLEQAALAEDARQGERLQDLLAFRQHYIQETVPAQVVGTSGSDRSRVLFLDKGSDDGIAPEMAVITPDGIVGRVREVYPHTAQVLEISDPTSAAGVLLEETRTRGILRGNTRGQPQIVNLMPDDRIKPGQLVLTSGGDQVFPRGLPVGVVDRIAPDPENEPMVDVILKPAANLNRLEEVLVVTGTAPAPTERARRDVAKSELVAAGARAAQEASLVDVQRASDVLAQRLPSRMDPADLTINPDSSPDASPATSEAQAKPLHPPSPLHPDHYTPNGIPPAQSLTPGQRYAPLVEGTAASERRAAKSAGNGDVNATEAAPVSGNVAFAAAASGMAAERKAATDAKAAEVARRYAATHPHPEPSATPGSETADAADPSGANRSGGGANLAGATAAGAGAPAVRYINRVNADGTTTRVAVPLAPTAPGTSPAVRYINRVNADGTTTRVAVPLAPTAPGTSLAVRYINRVNADGTTTRVAVPLAPTAPGTSPAVRYVNRVNADGTTTRVAVPLAPTAPGTSPAVRYVNRVNADGTTTRVAVPLAPSTAAGGSAAPLRYTTRANADGTTTRVPVLGAAATNTGTPAFSSTARVNADGTTTGVPAPRATAGAANSPAPNGYRTRVNADGTTGRVPVPATAAGSVSTNKTVQAPARPASGGQVPVIVVTDGPIAPGAGRPGAGGSVAGQPGAGQPVAGRPAAGQPSAGRPVAGRSVTGQPGAGQPIAGRPAAAQAAAGQPGAGRAAAGQAAAGQAAAGQAAAGQAAAGQPGAGRAAAGQAAAGQPGAGRPAAGQPGATAHATPPASATGSSSAAKPPVTKRKAPELVPDDGSRPPAPAPAPPPPTATPHAPQGER